MPLFSTYCAKQEQFFSVSTSAFVLTYTLKTTSPLNISNPSFWLALQFQRNLPAGMLIPPQDHPGGL